jgi:predicted methyltransferase
VKYNFNGKMINIPDSEIEKSMKILDLTKEQAIEMWLEDEGYLDNEEQLELTQKAKENKITATIHSARDVGKPKANKPKTVKVSEEKQTIFADILENLQKNYENVEIVKQNKLIQVKLNGKTFKIDLIEQRPPKNK